MPCPLPGLLLYFLRLGAIGFGGPVALVGYMQHDLVEERRWISKDEYLRGLTLSQLAPGPLAAQFAMYVGYVRHGVLGATLVAFAFILPSFLMVLGLGMLYVAYGGLEWMQAVFYGVGAAVIGIIVKSAYKLTKGTVQKKKLLWVMFGVMCVVTAYTEQESVWLFLLCGVVAIAVYAPPALAWGKVRSVTPLIPGILFQVPAVSQSPPFVDLTLFFAKAGSFVFGSGLAIVPFLHGAVVQQYQWLTERQFLDAVAVAMITPGPVVITVGFIGYLVSGLSGAVAAALGVFLPVYLVVVVLTPFYERFARSPRVTAFVEGVTSAATGAIAGAVIVLGRHAVIDLPAGLIAAGSLVAVARFTVPEPVVVIGAGVLGLLLFHLR